jgi:hypothetical protein
MTNPFLQDTLRYSVCKPYANPIGMKTYLGTIYSGPDGWAPTVSSLAKESIFFRAFIRNRTRNVRFRTKIGLPFNDFTVMGPFLPRSSSVKDETWHNRPEPPCDF